MKRCSRTVQKMKKPANIVITLILLSGITSWAQQTPASLQKEAMSIDGATAHLGNGEVIENSLIMFEEGKLTFVGSANTKIARKGQIIKGKGKHVYVIVFRSSRS